MKTDPPPDARCKDKFLVQSIAVPAEKEMPPVFHSFINTKLRH
jgi:hypothetical protein